MKSQRRFDLISPKDAVTPPPAERGRLVYDFEVPDLFFGGLPKIGNKVRWVRSHLPRESCIKIGHDSAWYESDVRAYIDSLQKVAS